MLLELRPAPGPMLNTLLTVLCTSLRLNYSTLPLMERLTVCLCMSWSSTVCVCEYVCVFMHGWISLESKKNVSFLYMYCMWMQLSLICVLESEGGSLESLNGPVMCGWLLSFCACGKMCARAHTHTHVCQVCLGRMWALCVFLGFSLSGSASFCSLPKINSAPSILFLAPISRQTQTL